MTLLSMIAAVALTAGPVSLQFDGPLGEALKQVAQKGSLNVVASGDLGEHVQVSLADVTAEEALETLARVYGLQLTHEGKLYVVRRTSVAPVVAAVPAPPALPAPVAPPAPPKATAAPDDDEADRAREEAEAARERAEELRQQAQDLAEARREQAQAARELARAHAEVEKNRVSAGGPVTVEANSVVDTAVAYGGPVVVEENAVVEGDAVAFGGDVVLKDNAVVKGDAVSFGGRVIRGTNSSVGGQSMAMGGTSLGTAISKGVTKGAKAELKEEDHGGNSLAVFLAQFALFFGLGFALMMFAPQRMKALEATIRAEPVRNGLAGLLATVASVPATLLLAVTIVGIPVVVLGWMAIAAAMPVGLAAVANTLGGVLPTWRLRRTQAVALALGVLALLLVARVPGLGPVALTCSLFVSMGAMVRTRFGQPRPGTPIIESSSTPLGV